jgi:hypothetical protein
LSEKHFLFIRRALPCNTQDKRGKNVSLEINF